MSWHKALQIFVLFLVTCSTTLAQTQYQNKVIVIPLWSDGSTWTGPWAASINYNRTDIVEFDGSSYIAIEPHISDLANIPPGDGTLWQLVAASGLTGSAGPAGPAGAVGAVGPAGPAGPQGPAGADGMDGAVGAVGPAGPQGPAGVDGMDGAAGAAGPAGPQGPAGADGMNGAVGAVGPAGPQGPAGADGMNGAAGAVGPAGPQGPAGADGMDGVAGPVGPQGPAGTSAFTAALPIFLGGVGNDVISFNAANIATGTIPSTALRRTDISQPSLALYCTIALFGVYPSRSQTEPFVGTISWVGFNFAPRGWALCDGQLLPIASNTALFSLLGTAFGGDGRTTFGLPDMRGRVAVGVGSGPGLSNRAWGSRFGSETIGQ
ncbi:MAG: tail fiber protein [Acidiferrobacterales bacterium]|nr:tail fiber protein [Acidiferrobacterales bacterium]